MERTPSGDLQLVEGEPPRAGHGGQLFSQAEPRLNEAFAPGFFLFWVYPSAQSVLCSPHLQKTRSWGAEEKAQGPLQGTGMARGRPTLSPPPGAPLWGKVLLVAEELAGGSGGRQEGTAGWARKAGIQAPQRPRPKLPLQGRSMAAPTGHASLDTSPITLYLCFTLLFFFSSSLIIVSLWGRQRI